MAKQWRRTDKADGSEELVDHEHVRLAAERYYRDADLAMITEKFSTPWAIYEFKDVPEGTTTDF